jgi:hypothetical protein
MQAPHWILTALLAIAFGYWLRGVWTQPAEIVGL